ncbi:MAG: DUF2142 domain-containing protein [Oscillospiraceae bacterium]|nr:DUF2142 domain-containing protein [Oscillospiraceae bacterium]
MKSINFKKTGIAVLALAVLLVCSFAVEMLWFQRNIFALEREQRLMTEVPFTRLELQDLQLRDDGWFEITGDSPAFRISDDLFVARLQIATNGETKPMHITLTTDDKVYDVDSRVKGISILRVNSAAEDVWFGVRMDKGETAFTIDSLTVDNTLSVNWLRVGFLCSLSVLVWFFVFFYRTAVTKLHVSFLVIALVIGINLAVATPVWYGLDEHAHYVRAYQFANFNLGFDHEAKLNWIYEMEDFFYQTGTNNSKYHNYEEFKAFLNSYDTNEYGMQKYYLTTAATYPFVPYFFAGLGILVAKLLGMPFVYTFFAGRIFNVLGYALICFFAIRTAKIGKRLLFLMSLVPYALFSAGVYTADTLTVSFAILAIALFGNMLSAEDGALDWKLPVVFALCCAAMAMCKLPYAPLCILILAVPLKKFRSNKHALWNFVLVFGVVGVISVATLLFGADKGIIQWYQPGMSIVGQVKYILTHPFRYAQIILNHIMVNWKDYLFGSTWKMGYCGDVSGIWAMLTAAVLAVAAAIDFAPENDRLTLLPRLACVAAIGCSWVLVMTALYVSYNVVGAESIAGVQGRYFYPLLIPLLLLLVNTRLGARIKGDLLNGGCYMLASAVGIAAAVHVFAGFCM